LTPDRAEFSRHAGKFPACSAAYQPIFEAVFAKTPRPGMAVPSAAWAKGPDEGTKGRGSGFRFFIRTSDFLSAAQDLD